jgi:hypothetical protein
MCNKCVIITHHKPKGRWCVIMARQKKYDKRIAVFFTSEQYEKLKKAADQVGVEVGAFVRMAVLEKLKNGGEYVYE